MSALCAAIRSRSRSCGTLTAMCSMLRSGLILGPPRRPEAWGRRQNPRLHRRPAALTHRRSAPPSVSKCASGGWSRSPARRLSYVPAGRRARLRQSAVPLTSGASLLPQPSFIAKRSCRSHERRRRSLRRRADPSPLLSRATSDMVAPTVFKWKTHLFERQINPNDEQKSWMLVIGVSLAHCCRLQIASTIPDEVVLMSTTEQRAPRSPPTLLCFGFQQRHGKYSWRLTVCPFLHTSPLLLCVPFPSALLPGEQAAAGLCTRNEAF